ncbi:MAG: GWxTD domain-containing protein [Candidatus Aminicenantes bacterium]|nr:GWxTD domain-containing protein [Candidatus Aminicenantes bacterium]
MKNKKKLLLALIISVFFASFLSFSDASAKKSDPWKKWLDEVHLIMTKAEESVFYSLKTEEDRKRFQEQFWKARDPKPETPYNEYKIEFYRRLKYADTQLEGPNSDRGRIYILLGEPFEKRNFSGYEDVVDCELWIYRAEGRPGLPPFMHILFYRPRNFGSYRQFHPGLHNALDIISPGYSLRRASRLEAYQIIKKSLPQLAEATLSIIPGEGDPVRGRSLTSSGSTIAQIYTLPEREVERNYLKNFATFAGMVDVAYSAKEIEGKGFISISENKGFTFLNYSIMPDDIDLRRIADNLYALDITINLRIEDLEGRTIHQQERNIHLEFDDLKKKTEVEERKLAFKDFAPIVEGEYNVIITFSNKTKEGYFIHKERISINEDAVPVLVGFKIKELGSDNFIPFSTEGYKVLADPRLVFNKTESLEGLVFSEQKPTIHLRSLVDKNNSFEIKDVVKQGNLFIFRQPLTDIKSDNYFLSIKNEKGEIYKKIISVISFHVEKPLDYERSEAASSEFNYIFVIGQEYINKGEFDKAIEYFNKLPENLWNSSTLPVIARAYYANKEYEKVVELLEKENVVKNYSVLLFLANSSLEIKRKQKAAEYFEMLRKYGDTVELNRVLGAIYHSLGEREKAKVYWERAENLEKSKKKNLNNNKEK